MSVSIRDATLDDAEAMAKILNEAVDEGAQTWDEHLSVTEAIDWMSKLHLNGYPCIILQDEAYSVLGYASLEPRSTSRYSGTKFAANLTCHVLASARRLGHAALLLNALFDHPNTVSRNVYLVRYAVLTTNAPAIRLLEKLEFYHCGALDDIAHLGEGDSDDHRCGLSIYTKTICPAPCTQGLGFPDLNSVAAPLSPKTFELPLDLDDEAFSIRRAEWTDLPFITAVYNHALLHSEADDLHGTISMTEKGETLSELLALGLPVYVASWDKEPIGYASLGPVMASEGSRFKSSLSLSIYLRPEITRQRVGNALWNALIRDPALERLKTRSIVAGVHTSNAQGYGAVLKNGFVPKIQLSRVYFKFGALKDASLFQYFLRQPC